MKKVIVTDEVAEKLRLINDKRVISKIHQFSNSYKSPIVSKRRDPKFTGEIYRHKLTPNHNLFYTTETDKENNEYLIMLDVVQSSNLFQTVKPIAKVTRRLGFKGPK
jgi:hypothetical protein